mmetsp:Transcript_9996/g.13594  ORF Transcript_9996/g.13594 Transcript_9996/m.13594 type:complete len:268 (+) Transcript_9996:35-838(+)
MKLNKIIRVAPVAALFLIGTAGLTSCNKEVIVEGTSSEFLEVEQTNSSFLVKHTGTWCAPCGGWGFTNFQSQIDTYGDTEVLAATVSGSLGGANNEFFFDAFANAFSISATPTFHGNLGQTTSGQLVNDHKAAPVVVNSNYEMTIEGGKINVTTTTEFFQKVSGEDYYIAPYILVDGIVAQQAGHPDGANTEHKLSIVDIATPVGVDKEAFGYKIASGEIRDGYRVNLNCEADFNAAWDESKVSVAIVITKRDGSGNPVFVNAFTKH